MAKSFKRQKRQKRVKKGGMNPDELRPPTLAEMRRSRMDATAPSSTRKKLEYAQMMHGPRSSKRPIGNQDRNLASLAAQTAAPRAISLQEKRIIDMLKKRTPVEIQRDREMNRQLSMTPLLQKLVRMERQHDFIRELRSIAPPNKKGEFDRIITECDRDRELLKQFIQENLSQEDGIMKMNRDHRDPLLNRDLNDIRIIGELKDIVNRCSRNRIELMDIIRDVYPELTNILDASGFVSEGVAKYLEDPYQPGYEFVRGALEKLNIRDDNELIDVLRNPFEDFEDDNELMESGYMDNSRWIKRSSPENTRFLPRMAYGSRKKRKSKRKSKRKTKKKSKRRRKKTRKLMR